MPIARPDETIAHSVGGRARAASECAPPGSSASASRAGDEIVSQVVDNDGDGTMDELIFQATFVPGESKRFIVESGAPAKPRPKRRVYAVHEDPRDDVAWESDRIAFRIYGQGLWKVDSLNSSGVDIWVKRVRDPIVDKWYAKGHDVYHRDNGEGADFFDVGEIARRRRHRRSGATTSCIARSTSRAMARHRATGPVRAIFELQYQPWDAAGSPVSPRRSASRSTRDTISITSSASSERTTASADIPWVTGIVKRKSVVGSESKAKPWAWLAEWGPLASEGRRARRSGIGDPAAARRGRGLEGDERPLHGVVAREVRRAGELLRRRRVDGQRRFPRRARLVDVPRSAAQRIATPIAVDDRGAAMRRASGRAARSFA